VNMLTGSTDFLKSSYRQGRVFLKICAIPGFFSLKKKIRLQRFHNSNCMTCRFTCFECYFICLIRFLTPSFRWNMASLLDSEAQFRQRAKECKLSEVALQDLARLGVTSFGLLAYSFGQPGQNIANEAFNNWLRQDR